MEILVHISASSTARDDARYRDQVNAILAYGPITHTQLSVSSAAVLESESLPTHDDHEKSIASDSLGSLISVIPDSQEDHTSKRPRLEPSVHADLHERNAAQDTDVSMSESFMFPMEIRPPQPPISTAQFTTHVTPTLSMLTTRLKPERVYRPLNQTRALHKLERGYWSLSITIIPSKPEGRQWSTHLFHRFWTFLSDFVGRDARAGWGVWCVADDQPRSNQNNITIVPGASIVRLKVYAWGEVAMHTYLLLFLASERQIRGMGAQWMDYHDEKVIQMP